MKTAEGLNPALDPSTDIQEIWTYPGDESTPEGSTYWYRLYLTVRAEQLDRAAQAASSQAVGSEPNFEIGAATGSLPLPDFMRTTGTDLALHPTHLSPER